MGLRKLDELVDSYLTALCEISGARYARIRLIMEPEGKRVIIAESIFDRKNACAPSGAVSGNYEMRLIDASDTEVNRCGVSMCWDIKSAFDSYSSRMPSGQIIHGTGTAWALKKPASGGTWLFERHLGGFLAEVLLEFEATSAGCIDRRLSSVSSLLELVEPLLSVFRTHCPGIESNDRSRELPLEPPLIGKSGDILELIRLVRDLSDSDIPILIEGESGTGKEVIARNIHRLSARRSKPLVIVNCMEIPSSLLQSEIFGHRRGSFTGALRDRVGLVESADGGTFFLDEIGEMPVSLQAALLRVLQEKEVRRIGESTRRNVDVRFVFATNRCLADMVSNGDFRADLYFRIKGARIHIPPLRMRLDDILPLAKHFLTLYSERHKCKLRGISIEAARTMLAYHWPGNVRELKNEMEFVAAMNGDNQTVEACMLSQCISEGRHVDREFSTTRIHTLPAAVEKLERHMICDALERYGGNRTRTASALGITRQGLLKKLKRLRISGETGKRRS